MIHLNKHLLNRLKAVENSLQSEKTPQAIIYLADGSTLTTDYLSACRYLAEHDNAVSAEMIDDEYKAGTMKAIFDGFIKYR